MGDRCVVVFASRGDVSPGVYVHWMGQETPQHLEEAQGVMRAGDPGYAAARYCAHLCSKHPGDIHGVGLQPPPEDLKPETLKEYSHGDAGVVVVDCDTGKVTGHAGYLAKHVFPDLEMAKG